MNYEIINSGYHHRLPFGTALIDPYPEVSTPMHFHDEYEVLMVTRHQISCRTNDGHVQVLKEGEIAIFTGETPHEILYEPGNLHILFTFSLKNSLRLLSPLVSEEELHIVKRKDYQYFLIGDHENQELADIIKRLHNSNQYNTRNATTTVDFEYLCGLLLSFIGIMKKAKIVNWIQPSRNEE